ncbi:single-stranded DNA-binding protein [Geodermatophilus sp. SYSU D00758]
MKEQHAAFKEFNHEEVSALLRADMKKARDLSHGEGTVLQIAEGKTVLEVFPKGVVRVTTERSRVEVHDIGGFALNPEHGHVVFEQSSSEERSRLVVRDNGKVSFYPVLNAAESAYKRRPQQIDAKAGQPLTDAPEPATTAPQPHDGTSLESGESEPVTLQGRLGRDPWFSGGVDARIAGFPLAVNHDDKTTWHKVVVFDETAEALKAATQRGEIRKGRLVDVSGRPVTREEETPRGTRKTLEIHATSVARVRAARSR